MTNKEKYIADLRSQYEVESEEFLELCWVLHDYDKARGYADLLSTCTSYADIAQKVIRPMYVSGDIDDIRARSEKFLSLLIPLACLGIDGNSHAAVYHVRQMLDDADVRAERKTLSEQRFHSWRATQEATTAQANIPFCKVTVKITDMENMRMFIDFLKSAGPKFSVEVDQFFLCATPDTMPQEYIVINDTPQWLHATLSDLRANCPNACTWTYSLQSAGIVRHNITLSELLRLIGQNTHDEVC